MKISDISSSKSAASVKKRKGVEGAENFSSFLLGETSDVHESSEIPDMHAVSSLDGVLSLQEISEDEVKKKRAVAHANKALDSLEQLRLALLTGELPVHTLRNLSVVVENHKALGVNDPKLSAILDDIELRVAVELAKLEVAEGHIADETV